MTQSDKKEATRCPSRRGWAALAIIAVGTTFLSIPSCEGVLTTLNPCGTVLAFCDPFEIDALFADVPDFSVDPSCSLPFFGVRTGDTSLGCSSIVVFDQTPGPRPEGQQP